MAQTPLLTSLCARCLRAHIKPHWCYAPRAILTRDVPRVVVEPLLFDNGTSLAPLVAVSFVYRPARQSRRVARRRGLFDVACWLRLTALSYAERFLPHALFVSLPCTFLPRHDAVSNARLSRTRLHRVRSNNDASFRRHSRTVA